MYNTSHLLDNLIKVYLRVFRHRYYTGRERKKNR